MIKLISAIYDAYNRSTLGQPWYPVKGTTFCNLAVNFICNAIGYTKFNTGPDTSMLANAMIALMKTSTDWMNIDANVAQAHANVGAFVLAGEINPGGHGHICVVIAGDMKYSDHFSKNAPLVMNVGRDVFIGKHAGFSFQSEPSYFVLVSTIPTQGT